MDTIDVSQSHSGLTEVIDASAHAGGPLSVPASGWLMGADFAREGHDLVVSGADGQHFVVTEYFATDTPPDLMTAENGTLRGDIVAQKAGPLNPGGYAQAAGTAESEPIGIVETLEGGVEAIRGDGTKVTLEQGDPIFRGDLIETSSNGSVSMLMADDSVFSLDADGTVKMDELVYDPEDQEGSMSVSLVKGVFSFVSGEIAKTDPDAMVLKTPLATVGIRGTTGVLELPEGGSVQIVLAPDANGEIGELTIQPLGLDGQPFGAPVTVNIPLAAVGVAPGGGVQTFTIPAAQFAARYQAIVDRSTSTSTQNTGGNDDDGDAEPAESGDGDEEAGVPDDIETKGAAEAANDQDQSEAAEDEAEEQEKSKAAEEAAAEEAESGQEEAEAEQDAEGDAEELEVAAEELAELVEELVEEREEQLEGTLDGGEEDDGNEELPEEEESGEGGEGGGTNNIQLAGGTVTVPLTSADDNVWGTSGFDRADLMGTAQSGDTIDLMGDADIVNLYPGNNVLSVYNTETINHGGAGGNDTITVMTSFVGSNNSVNLGSDTDILNLADGGNEVSVMNVETINGGSGMDSLTYSDGIDFTGTTFNSIDNITFGTSEGGTMQVDSTTNFGVGPCLTINGDANTQTISSTGGLDLRDVMLVDINNISLDSNGGGDELQLSGTAPVDLLVDSTTVLGLVSISNGSAVHHHITSNDGLNLEDVSMFTGGGRHSILINNDGGTASTLTVSNATDFGVDGGSDVTEIRRDETNGGNETISSNDGINFSGTDIEFYGIGAVNFDADGGGVATLAFDSIQTNGVVPTFNGNGGDDIISALGGGQIDFTGFTFTGINMFQTSGGFADDVTLDVFPSGVTIDLGTGTDILKSASGFNANFMDVESFIGGTGTDIIRLLNNAATTNVFDSGGGSNEVLNLMSGTNTLTVTNFDFLIGSSSNDTITLEGAATSLTIDGGTGTDILNLGNFTNTLSVEDFAILNGGSGTDTVTLSAVANDLTITGIESLTGSAAGDAISATIANIAGMTLDGAANSDTLTILDAGTLNATNLMNVSNFETWVLTDNSSSINITTADGNVTAGNTLVIGGVSLSSDSSLTFDGSVEAGATGAFQVIGGAGSDILTGGGDADILTGNADSDILVGGAGNDTLNGGADTDTITGGDGQDVITTGAGADLVLYTSTSQYGDTITDFTAGGSGDVIDFDAGTIAILAGNMYEAITAGGAVQSDDGLIQYLTDITNYNNPTSVASELNSGNVAGLVANDIRLFLVGNGTNSDLWFWSDSDSGGDVDSGELTSIAEFTGTAQGTFDENDFNDFTSVPP